MPQHERQHKVALDSTHDATPSTSVKKVISELEATLGLRSGGYNLPLDRKASASLATDERVIASRLFTCKTDVRTQTDREVPEARLLNSSRMTQPRFAMESDSSFHDSRPVHPLTTVSVSTCPSCGSENVSSESHPTKRSASFHHLLHSKRHTSSSSASKLSPNADTSHLLRSQSFTFTAAGKEAACGCHCRCTRPARHASRGDVGRSRKTRKKKSDTRLRHSSSNRCLTLYPDHLWPSHAGVATGAPCTHCKFRVPFEANPMPRPLMSGLRPPLDRSRSFADLGLRSNYRFWDIDEWREQVKRDQAKKRERRSLIIVSAFGIIVFICVSYFGTLLFLRVTKLP